MSDGSSTYLYGLGRIAQKNIVGWQYYQPDALGSVRQLVNPADTVIQARNYEPFGVQLSVAGNPLTKYAFTGEWQDPTGLIFLRARCYDPAIGRFLSKDPVRGIAAIPQTLNPYTYALNNPILYTDPSGEIIPLLIFAAVGLAGGILGGLGYYGLETWLSGNSCASWDWGEAAFWGLTGGVIGIPLGIGAGWLGGLAGWWGTASTGVWSLPWWLRGQLIEDWLGRNLARNFPTIDRLANGIATSIKSLNIAAPTYQDIAALTNKVQGYINTLASFQGARNISPNMISDLRLELVIPYGLATSEQWAAFYALYQYAANLGVIFHVIQMP